MGCHLNTCVVPLPLAAAAAAAQRGRHHLNDDDDDRLNATPEILSR